MSRVNTIVQSFLTRFVRPERLDAELQLALVRSLYRPIGQIIFSTLMSTVVSLYAYSMTSDRLYLLFATAFGTVGTLRFASLMAFRRFGADATSTPTLTVWEHVAMAGAFGFATIVGVTAGYASWTGIDLMSEFLIVASALSYAAGIPGRNVARKEIVMGQATFTCVPMFVGLAVRCDLPHEIMATIVGLSGILALSLASRLARTAIDGHRADKRLRHMARFDGLTGLLNRNGFLDAMGQTIVAHAAGGRCALVAIDLDRFKEVNDSFGHPAGDRLLVNVGDRIRSRIRPGDFAARIAGDEFHVVLVNVTVTEAEDISKRILEELAKPHSIDTFVIPGSASIGTAMIEADDGVDAIMVRADLALYKSKGKGRGCVTMFTAEIKSEFEHRRRLEEDLPGAIGTDQIFVVYQPIVDTHTGKVRTCEALVRWVHPTLGFVSPAHFIPIAERTGCIHDLGRKVLHRACADAVTWAGEVGVAVNVSPLQFERGDGVVLDIMSALVSSGLPASRLEVEITESIFIGNGDRAKDILRQVNAAGVRVSLDDFGTGYSSLGYVKDFHFDKVKVDKKFTDDLDSPRTMAVVKAVRHMTDDLGIDLVIEGVERATQLACVNAEGIHLIQGYLFSKPLPIDEVRAKIASMSQEADDADDAGRPRLVA